MLDLTLQLQDAKKKIQPWNPWRNKALEALAANHPLKWMDGCLVISKHFLCKDWESSSNWFPTIYFNGWLQGVFRELWIPGHLKMFPSSSWWWQIKSCILGGEPNIENRHLINIRYTLPETNGSPLKIGLPNRKVVFQPSIFRGYVSFREGIQWDIFKHPIASCRVFFLYKVGPLPVISGVITLIHGLING